MIEKYKIIEVNDLTMEFRLSKEKIDNLKEFLIKKMKNEIEYKTFCALKDINFEVFKGERIGIIGHNGAGKSTLLKIICGIMKPTKGEILINGNIAPLLELGAGFDGEFTGAQNIYLNASLLGLKKKEIDNLYDSIIQFADLGEFIDVPVKNYSSGMRAKLGFSIASHIDLEILILDEVLGVGDESFKRKSSAKIKELINSGKTVILVSHSLEQVKDLTDRVIWLDKGSIMKQGDSEIVCDEYKEYMKNK